MAQLILDGIRYGFAPTKIVWSDTHNTNQIVNFNPRKTFPDPRVSWGDWDQAQYIIFSDHITYNNLLASGSYPKLRLLPQLRQRMGIPRQAWESHRNLQEEGRGLSLDPAEPQKNQGNQTFWSLGHNRIVDEVWVRLAGYEINVPARQGAALPLAGARRRVADARDPDDVEVEPAADRGVPRRQGVAQLLRRRGRDEPIGRPADADRKSTRLNSSHRT